MKKQDLLICVCNSAFEQFLRTMTFQPVIWNTVKDKDVQLNYRILEFNRKTENNGQELQNKNRPCVQDTSSQSDLAAVLSSRSVKDLRERSN